MNAQLWLFVAASASIALTVVIYSVSEIRPQNIFQREFQGRGR